MFVKEQNYLLLGRLFLLKSRSLAVLPLMSNEIRFDYEYLRLDSQLWEMKTSVSTCFSNTAGSTRLASLQASHHLLPAIHATPKSDGTYKEASSMDVLETKLTIPCSQGRFPPGWNHSSDLQRHNLGCQNVESHQWD